MVNNPTNLAKPEKKSLKDALLSARNKTAGAVGAVVVGGLAFGFALSLAVGAVGVTEKTFNEINDRVTVAASDRSGESFVSKDLARPFKGFGPADGKNVAIDLMVDNLSVFNQARLGLGLEVKSPSKPVSFTDENSFDALDAREMLLSKESGLWEVNFIRPGLLDTKKDRLDFNDPSVRDFLLITFQGEHQGKYSIYATEDEVLAAAAQANEAIDVYKKIHGAEAWDLNASKLENTFDVFASNKLRDLYLNSSTIDVQSAEGYQSAKRNTVLVALDRAFEGAPEGSVGAALKTIMYEQLELNKGHRFDTSDTIANVIALHNKVTISNDEIEQGRLAKWASEAPSRKDRGTWSPKPSKLPPGPQPAPGPKL